MLISREATVKMKAVAKFSFSFLVLVSVIFGLATAQTQLRRQYELNRRTPGSAPAVRNREPVSDAPARSPVRQQGPVQPAASGTSEETDPELSENCPEPNGYFADAEQCDKYYQCRDGQITEKLCPDGMVFNDYDLEQEKCDLPFNIDCSKRPKLQTPIPSLHCPRQNGYFASETGACDKFYYCVDGMFNMITCPEGLVFNPRTGICTWPDEAQRTSCTSEDVFKFSCPKVNESEAATHPRYADPDDCQFFYVCINGETPRRNGCRLGQAFDDVAKHCEWARKVPDCADWYKDRLTDKQLDELENPPTPKPKPANSPSKVSRRRPSKRPKQPEADVE
ncbi:protein obstructor-E [Anopheles ziemanni]|uniref:protein obstructor-E n=1 Tax=Anopheles coustani TaxID=139045 RepID=UPI00265A52F9|nr:protein obstructor-E [Anopheles coustani]XP_058166626.1 protein obstructor-E [Anopheles ziemanni]